MVMTLSLDFLNLKSFLVFDPFGDLVLFAAHSGRCTTDRKRDKIQAEVKSFMFEIKDDLIEKQRSCI